MYGVFSASKFSCTYVGHSESLLAYSSRIYSAKIALTSFSCHSPVDLIIRYVRISVLRTVPLPGAIQKRTSERLTCRRLSIQCRLEFMFLCVPWVLDIKYHPMCSYHKSFVHFSLSITSSSFFAQQASPSPSPSLLPISHCLKGTWSIVSLQLHLKLNR